MSKLEKLIEEFCPDGVEYTILNKVCKIYDGTHQTPNYTDRGVKFVSVQNINALYDTEKCISEEEFKKYKIKPQIDDVLMTRIGSIGVCTVVDRDEPLAYYVSLALLRPDAEKLNSKFLKYAIESLHGRKELRKRTLINAVPIKINKDDIGKVTLPVPPLPVQSEIVRILDNFTELTAELTTELSAELTARKKQYEYYRDSILSENSRYPQKTLGDICEFVRGPFGGSLKKECFTKQGYAVYEQQHAIYGEFAFRYYVDEGKFNQMKRFEVQSGDLIMSCSGTMGKVSIIPEDAPKGIINQALLKLTAKNGINNKYLKYCFENSITSQLNDSARGGAIKNVASVSVLKEIKICVPPLAEQERIVDILDRFDTLCNDISAGLPAEIEARKKQYEYYRDKLLTFKELS